MKVTDRLKQIIFKQLYRELGDCEIIPYNGSIWFINRDNKHWYFELDKDGTLWWRYDFFNSFFQIFSMDSDDFCPVLSSWVEEVLNHKVSTTYSPRSSRYFLVEEVLNHKVSTTGRERTCRFSQVEDVLNHKVSTTLSFEEYSDASVEEVLNHKISRTCQTSVYCDRTVEEVLNHKVCTTDVEMSVMDYVMEQVLNQ